MLTVLHYILDINVYFLLWGVIAYWLLKNKYRMSSFFLGIGIVLFLACSTNYLPKKLARSVERNYDPISLPQLDKSKKFHIYVLGSGTALDPKLPASTNLGPIALTRLVEGIRVYNGLINRVLVTSAASEDSLMSQAKITKEAAISLGVQREDIEMLETPTSTREEAIDFKAKFGTDKHIILVTSALHMPRAVEIFKDQGLQVIAAPTDYQYKGSSNSYNGISLPSLHSLRLMNRYQITMLKVVYYRLFYK